MRISLFFLHCLAFSQCIGLLNAGLKHFKSKLVFEIHISVIFRMLYRCSCTNIALVEMEISQPDFEFLSKVRFKYIYTK